MKNYLNLVLTGYKESPQFFTDYLIREQKKAERDDFIEDVEFFKKCNGIVLLFKSELDKELNERKRELYQIITYLKENGTPEDLKEIKQELETLSRNNFTVHLHSLSNGNFSGHLWAEQVIDIEDCVTNAGRYIHYLKRKRFGFITLNEYKAKEYDTFFRQLKSYKFSFDFIKKKLSQEQSFEFANDFLDLLKRIQQKQSLSKFILIITLTIDIIKKENAELFEITSTNNVGKGKSDSPEKKKLGQKYYSLLYWIELNANGESPPMTLDGAFIKSEIEVKGKAKGCGTGQQFYREFTGLKPYLNNTIILEQKFGTNWKETIIDLSKNEQKIIEYIEKQYPE